MAWRETPSLTFLRRESVLLLRVSLLELALVELGDF